MNNATRTTRYLPFASLVVATAALMIWQVSRSESPMVTAVWLMFFLGVGLGMGVALRSPRRDP